MKKTLPVRPFDVAGDLRLGEFDLGPHQGGDLGGGVLDQVAEGGLAGMAFGSTSGIEVTVVGTPFVRSPLLTVVLQLSLSSRFMLPCPVRGRIPAELLRKLLV